MRLAFRSRSTPNLIAPAACFGKAATAPPPCLAIQSPLTQNEAVVQRGWHGLLFVPHRGHCARRLDEADPSRRRALSPSTAAPWSCAYDGKAPHLSPPLGLVSVVFARRLNVVGRHPAGDIAHLLTNIVAPF